VARDASKDGPTASISSCLAHLPGAGQSLQNTRNLWVGTHPQPAFQCAPPLGTRKGELELLAAISPHVAWP
jgi:hypothetical protein